MGEAHKTYNEHSRVKSRTLLERLKKNSLLLDQEIDKLHSQCYFVISEHQNRLATCESEHTKSWKIRNDSSGVGGLLCPDIFSSSVQNNINEQDEMTAGGRILITSKRPAESLPLRKPIRGCYCNHEPRKVLYRSPRTKHKSDWPCDYCKSNFDIRLSSTQQERDSSSPTLSCKTLQKVQRINYTPRSEFLRRVQRKVSQQYNVCGDPRSGSASPMNEDECHDDMTCKRLSTQSNYRTCVRETDVQKLPKNMKSPKNLEIAECNTNSTKQSHTCPCVSKTGILSRRSTTSRSKSKNREVKILHDPSSNERNDVKTPDIQTIFPSCMKSKDETSSRAAVCSSGQSIDAATMQTCPQFSSRSRKKTRVLSQKRSGCMDCCLVKETMKKRTDSSSKTDRSNPKCCRCLSRLCPVFVPQDNSIDQEAVELQKFREKNYYDTHGSRQTLLFSPQSSSGSLEQFRINQRLFPESIGKIHRNDLVVSMPICATEQLKRIHYFPRHIVKQQKGLVPTESHNKKGRYQCCPLTGHAIDLGALKVPCPVNSLALKFQKGVASRKEPGR